MSAPLLKQFPDYPLTQAQAGIWFAQKIDPTNPIYNLGEYIEIRGPIDAALFEGALNQKQPTYDQSI
jgi:Condensation domain